MSACLEKVATTPNTSNTAPASAYACTEQKFLQIQKAYELLADDNERTIVNERLRYAGTVC